MGAYPSEHEGHGSSQHTPSSCSSRSVAGLVPLLLLAAAMALPLPSLNVEVCDYDDRLPVCSNRILSEEERNQEWFQRANLYLGAGLLIATGTIFVVRLALQSYRKATKTVLYVSFPILAVDRCQ